MFLATLLATTWLTALNVSLSPLISSTPPIGGRLVHVGALQVVRASVIAERLFKRSLCYNTDSYVEASRVFRGKAYRTKM